jgi:hypothetical protein
MSICQWGHARLAFEEDIINDFDDQDHMDLGGEFSFSVNEACLSCDHDIVMVAPTHTDAHSPLLVHLRPSDMNWKRKHAYVPPAKKMQRGEERRTFRSRRSARVKASVMVLCYWTNHGTTGMALARGHKTPTLAMVTPHLRQHGYGDRRTGECILLLKGEDNTG